MGLKKAVVSSVISAIQKMENLRSWYLKYHDKMPLKRRPIKKKEFELFLGANLARAWCFTFLRHSF